LNFWNEKLKLITASNKYAAEFFSTLKLHFPMIRIFFAILGLLSFHSAFTQPSVQDLDWYLEFFTGDNRQLAEQRIAHAALKASEAHEMNDGIEEARAHKEAGLLQLTLIHDYGKAMDHFIRSLRIEDSLSVTNEKVFTLLAMGEVQAATGNHYKSSLLFEQAQELTNTGNDDAVRAYISLKLGKLDAAIGRMDEAHEKFSEALKYIEILDDPAVKAEALFQIGILYALQRKYDDALQNHKAALSIRREIEDKKNEAVSLNAIGELYYQMKNAEKSLANHIVALQVRQQIKDQEGIAQSYNNIGQLYIDRKDFPRAIANLNLALVAGQDSQSQHQMRKSYEYLSLCLWQ
jgi:tetratricopeptide (TPR) repeat protein